MQRQYIEKKVHTVVQIRNVKCEWRKLYINDVSVIEHLKKSFSYKRPLPQDQLVDEIK